MFGGLVPHGAVLLNSSLTAGALGVGDVVARRLVTVPATELAREHLGRPLPGPALLGGFAALTAVVSLAAVVAAVRQRFAGETGEGNAAAAEAAYLLVDRSLRETAGA